MPLYLKMFTTERSIRKQSLSLQIYSWFDFVYIFDTTPVNGGVTTHKSNPQQHKINESCKYSSSWFIQELISHYLLNKCPFIIVNV